MNLTPTPTQRARRIRQQFPHLTAALDYAADGITGVNFYTGRGQLTATFTYAELRTRAMEWAYRLAAMQLSRNTRVAIVATTEADFHIMFYACHYAGLTPVPVPPPLQLGGRHEYAAHLRALLQASGAGVCVGPEHCDTVMHESARDLRMRFVGSFDAFSHLTPAFIPLRPSTANELAYLQFTSGSTRFPKGVMISNRALMSNLLGTTQHLAVNDDDRAVSWLPYYHDMGLVGMILAPMSTQMSVDYLGSREFAMRPRQWLLRLSASRATISFAPPFGYELCARNIDESTLERIDLSRWRIAGIGADQIRPATLAAFAERMRPSGFDKSAFLPCYGLAESTLAVTLGRLNAGIAYETIDSDTLAKTHRAVPLPDTHCPRLARAAAVFVDCGRPLPGHTIEIRDPHGIVLPDRHCGQIFVRGPSTMSGYIDEHRQWPRIEVPDTALATGDIGYVVSGRLFVTGREKDMMISNGRNVWPQDLEFLAEQCDGVRTGDTSAFSVPDAEGGEQIVLVVQCRQRDAGRRLDLIRQLRGAIVRELGIECLIDLVPPRTLNRTSSGKLSRAATRTDFLNRSAPDAKQQRAANNTRVHAG